MSAYELLYFFKHAWLSNNFIIYFFAAEWLVITPYMLAKRERLLQGVRVELGSSLHSYQQELLHHVVRINIKVFHILRVVATVAVWPTVCPKPPGNTAATPAVWVSGLVERWFSPTRFGRNVYVGLRILWTLELKTKKSRFNPIEQKNPFLQKPRNEIEI